MQEQHRSRSIESPRGGQKAPWPGPVYCPASQPRHDKACISSMQQHAATTAGTAQPMLDNCRLKTHVQLCAQCRAQGLGQRPCA